MYKKLCLLTSFIILVGIANIAAAVDPVAYYPMEEGSGTVVGDATGNGHDGTIVGTLVWGEGAPNFGGGLIFDGVTANYVNLGTLNPSDPATGKISGTAWIKWAGSTTWTIVAGKSGGGSMMFQWLLDSGGQYGVTVGGGFPAYGTISITNGEWTHVAFSNDGTQSILYVNAENAGTITQSFDQTLGNGTLYIGSVENPFVGRLGFNGTIDEVAFFNTALTEADIQDVINGALGVKGPAIKPQPSNGSTDISINVGEISWAPGEYAYTHNVFFGTDKDSVTNATVENPLGTSVSQGLDLDSNSVALGRLEYATTYFWRVDEVNAPSSPGTATGKVWSFTTELGGYPILPASIINVTGHGDVYIDEQEPNSTCNELGLDANDMHSIAQEAMWLGAGDATDRAYLQYEFDKVYKLYDMLVWNYNEEAPNNEYFGAKGVDIAYSLDGQSWTTLEEIPEFNMATGDNTCVANTTVLFGGAAAKYVKLTFLTGWGDMDLYGISEVRFSAEPTRAGGYFVEISPEDAATSIGVAPELSWKAGRYADKHNVYISTDVNAVKDGTVDATVRDAANISPALDLGKTYYWRVDEVNNAEDYPVWDGSVWSFTTVSAIVIDNFEVGYDDTEVNAVWTTWIDGLGNSIHGGSQMGNDISPFLSTINHSGGHSAPMKYNNTGTVTYSEVTAQSIELPIGTTDWLIGSPTALVIWFRGEPNNTPAQIYVKLNSSKVLYDGDPSYLTQSVWRPFVVDLSKFNVNIGNITSITFGVEKTGSQAGSGTVLIDDIALHGVGPEIAEAVNPSNVGLIAIYSMENKVQDDSGSGLNGTIIGAPTYVQGPTGYGTAMQFNGTTDCVNLGNKAAFNPEGSFSVSLWAKIGAWSTNWNHVLIGNRGEDSVGWQLRRYSSNRFCFTTRGISNDDMYSNANPPPLNEWIHITCVYDSEAFTKTIYINGVLDRTINQTGTTKKIAATTHNTYIGARANSGNTGPDTTTFFTGMLDQILIYGRALSAGEAAYLADPTP